MKNFVKKNKKYQIFSIKPINLKKLFTLGIILILLISSFLIFIPKIEAQNRFSGSGSGTPSDPYVITNVKQLQEMKYDLKAHYVLGNDIDASETKNWNNGQGFEPIGDKDNPFTGSFDGRGYKIYNLYINTTRDYVGLFGYVGKEGIIKNVGLENVKISSTGGDVGGLIGWNSGIVSNSYSTGSVNGEWHVGGLVGYNVGTISNSYSTGAVKGNILIGGLVGSNDRGGIVSNSYSKGSVNGTWRVGGLVGHNAGEVFNSYSIASVNGNHDEIGGLVGVNSGIVSKCYSTGSVNGQSSVGGLIGYNTKEGTVFNCFSTSSVSGKYVKIGGLIGSNHGKVSNCYSIGTVKGYAGVGGLIGHNEGTVSNSFWDIQTSGNIYSAGGTGKTSEEMKNVRTYTNVAWSKGLESPWDFVGNPYDDKGNEDIWDIAPNVNNGYPYLTILPPPPTPLVPTLTETMTSLTTPALPIGFFEIIIIALITGMLLTVLPFVYRRRKRGTTKRIPYPEEKSSPVLVSKKEYSEVAKGIEETITKPSILKMEATKLSVDEWGKILVKIKGKGKVSINLEGNVDWKDPGSKELSGETTIEIPVKPKISGDVPVKVIIDSPYGKESSTILLKVEKKEVKPLELPVPIIDKGKVPEIVDIIPLRNMPLKNLVSGYGCSSKLFKVNLSSPIVPKEFEGAWDCCLLGCGGWGCAYLCVRGENKVVIKLPRGFEAIIERSIEAPTSHEAFLKKIKSEAEIMGSLNHPNIIKLLGVSNSVPLVIYEFADYGSLYWQLIKGWRPSLRDVVLIGIQLGDALRYIHSRGLIHGDIKPSNVFIKNGIAKLGDFSSTVKLLSSVSISKMVYTVGFRAPEQVFSDIRKKARELGVENRIDIYQLGNLLVYTLTGESIDGEEAGDDKLLMEKLKGISNEDLKQILSKTLALEPEKRPSAEDLIKMLYTVWNKV
jgi:tRNA A-37 threonylcarbamoyl transferase component Bud32